jgi:hypothetical protein
MKRRKKYQAYFFEILLFYETQVIVYFCRSKKSKKSDERISLTTDILNGIKIIKMNCWENPFKEMIKKIRK